MSVNANGVRPMRMVYQVVDVEKNVVVEDCDSSDDACDCIMRLCERDTTSKATYSIRQAWTTRGKGVYRPYPRNPDGSKTLAEEAGEVGRMLGEGKG